MSWQAGSFLVLGIVLVGGFAWYERSRPPAQIVALVAALAALAVAGRVAFPVIPNVVATTDVVFFCGYAIGAAPGFAVGALAGLVSNFWLGQGPWTPWQMAGWGVVGLAGAGLARLSRRRLGRIPLAAACGLAGLAYGALLDYSLMATYGGEQSLDRFLALSARGIPFNIAHAAGNVVIALIAGPALVRMLIRFRERFEVDWRPREGERRIATGTAIALIAVGLWAGSLGSDEEASAAAGKPGAVSWLRGAQNDDGGFGTAPGADSNPGMTGWAVLGLEAGGVNPLDMAKTGKTPIDYLRANAASVRTIGDLERTILVLRGAGLGGRKFGGRDLVESLRRQRDADGSWGGQVNATTFGILALKAAGAGGSSGSAAWLRGVQNPDGGWGFAPRTTSDADSTGAALQALATAGGSGDAISKGVGFLRGAQQPGGGFALSGGSANSQSTAWAVQGLIAAGVDPGSLRRGGTPLRYLAGRQAADGHYRYSASSDQTPVWVTGQALTAVFKDPFPIAAVARSTRSASKAPTASSGGSAAPSAATSPSGSKTSKPAAKPAAGAVAGATATSPAAPVPAAGQPEDEKDDAGVPAWLLALAGAAALGGALWGGWVLYSRRLP
ncbi:MAG: prenyltransferase/squalene oxidase repeat-containing protein [Solirubrobacterales bacterium]